jgi:hypothetical protein
VKFVKDPSSKSLTLQKNEMVPLKLPTDRQIGGRLSVIEEQNFKKRQEITVKVKFS